MSREPVPPCLNVCCNGCSNIHCKDDPHFGPNGIRWPNRLYLRITYDPIRNPPNAPCDFGIGDGQVFPITSFDGTMYWQTGGFFHDASLSDPGCDPILCGKCGPIYLYVFCSNDADNSLRFGFGGFATSPIGTVLGPDMVSCWPLLCSGGMPLTIGLDNQLSYTTWTIFQ